MTIWDWWGILFLLVMGVITALGVSRIKSNAEDVLQWLPDQSAARQDYDFFVRNFNSDDFVFLTWPGCTTADPRLREFAQRLRERDQDHLLAQVTTGYDLTLELGQQLGISRSSIVRRMQGVFFGLTDSDRTCATIELSHDGTSRRGDVMQMVDDVIDATDGLEPDQISMAGYPYLATAIDDELKGSYRRLLLPSVALATLIALYCLKNIRLGVVVFLTSTGAAAVSASIAPLCGVEQGGLMVIIPALVFVLATSGSIHLIRYSLDRIGDPKHLLAVGWKPCVISTLTTAVGMLSLLRSEFPAIRNFGLFCAVGVVAALAFQLIVVPWLLMRIGQPGLQQLARTKEQANTWDRVAHFVRRQRWLLATLFLALIAGGSFGLLRLRAEVELEKLFRDDSEILVSLRELENRFSPMDQIEVLLVFDHVDREGMYRRADYTQRVQQQMQRVDDVGVAFSLVNFLPSNPTIRRPRDLIRRNAYREYLEKHRDDLADGNFLAIDVSTGQEIWRISVRVPFTEPVNFDRLKQDLAIAAQAAVANMEAAASESDDADASPIDPPQFVFSGHTYLFHHAQVTLLEDLLQNFLLAFAIIAPLLMLVLRSVSIGVIAMLPNIFPSVVVFGGLGWVGYPVDLALAMTASVALGIAVDDTTHFLIRFRDHGGSLRKVNGPVRQTIHQCGPAMFHTTLIASASLMTYYFSEMLVVTRFAWAISLLLVVALIADVLLLPAVLFLLDRTSRDRS